MAPAQSMLSGRDLLERPLPFTRDMWGLETVAGRFVEISGGPATGAFTTCAGLIAEVQQRGMAAAWINGENPGFFPPDLAASGVDLAALPVIKAGEKIKACHVADTLVRTSAFSLVLLNLGVKAQLPFAVQTRLVGLAKKHHTAILLLTRTNRYYEQRGSLVSLRAETEKRRTAHDCFLCEVHVSKDKQRVPGWNHAEMCRGTLGLC
ncbi:MAG: recombinase A [Candidatus Hydrogenedentes bacterium]|nr:recombinase A [Candidatus Hydrogenedentota bacterium]